MKKLTASLIALLFVVLALCSCGANKAAEGLYYDRGGYSKSDGNYAAVSESNPSEFKNESATEVYESPKDESVSQKLIKRYRFVIESKKYDESKSALEALVAKYNGYFSSSSESVRKNSYADARYGTFQIRVPGDKVDGFASEAKNLGNVTSSTLNTEDITESYYSLKSQLESLAVQEERVLAMIEKANDLNTLIKLEDKLTSIRSQITQINYKIKYYDNSVDYSYVTVELTEVIEYTEVKEEVTFWTRLGDAVSNTFVVFGNVVGEILIGLIWILPFALVLGAVAVIAIVVTKKNRKKKAAKESEENK